MNILVVYCWNGGPLSFAEASSMEAMVREREKDGMVVDVTAHNSALFADC